MRSPEGAGGIPIFLVLAAIALAAAFAAFSTTGPKGIEQRFEEAAGISGTMESHGSAEYSAGPDGRDVHSHDSGGSISLEGNPVLYGLVLAFLVAISAFAYRAWGRK